MLMSQLPGWVAPVSVLTLAGILIGTGMWIGAVNSDRTTFKAFMKEVRDDIKTILGRLPSPAETKQSPLRLNDLGRTVSRAINADVWADKILPDVAERLKGSEAFEIEDFCFMYVGHVMEYSEQEKRLIKRVGYENGLTDNDVRRVLAIELRDKLLTSAGLEAP